MLVAYFTKITTTIADMFMPMAMSLEPMIDTVWNWVILELQLLPSRDIFVPEPSFIIQDWTYYQRTRWCQICIFM